MNNKYLYLFIAASLSVLLAGCGLFGPSSSNVKVDPLLLPGRWEASSQVSGCNSQAKLILVFLKDECAVSGTVYGQWGWQLDQGDNEPSDWSSAEAEMLDTSAEGNYHRNGWFGWDVENNDEIQTFQMTSVGDAVVPYVWKVKAFSSTSMTLVDAGKTYVFTKVN